MAQFDVCRSTGRDRISVPYVVVVQTAKLDHLPTRLVIPLASVANLRWSEPRMLPVFDIEGNRVVLVPWQMQTVRKSVLGLVVHSLADDTSAGQIIHAIDMVITRAHG